MAEPQWVTTSIFEELHDFGDRMHGQKTEFDDSNPSRPGRYYFAINPADRSVVWCGDDVTKLCKGVTITDETQWVANWIRGAIKIADKPHKVVRPLRHWRAERLRKRKR